MQVVDRPRFRQDLVAEAIEEGGHKFIDVGDPDSGNMFRFYEVEFSIACGMDGERDVAGIVQWAKDELGLTPSTKEVREVISTLAQLSFLDQSPVARAAATDRPTASAAASSRETELAAGVVVGQQQKRPAAGLDLELGQAGAKVAAAAPLPKGAEFELGTPGAGAATAMPPRAPVEDVGLGAPGARNAPAAAKSDVSLDLADHMGVKPDDVKEAVRQSRQMTAVEAPKDLLDQADAPVPPPKATPAAATPAAVTPVAATPAAAQKPAAAVAAPVEKKPAAAKPVEQKPAESKPLEKKPAPQERPIVVAEKKPMPEAPRQGISPMLIILLVLAIGGAGAYFAWRYLIRGKTETSAKVTPPPVTPASGSVAAPTPPPAPVQPKAKIEIAAGAPRDILGVFAGNIESIDVTERDVDTSDILAKLVGAKRLEADIANLDKEIERRKATVKAAEDARAKLNPAPAEGSAEQPKAPSEAQVKAADALVAKTMKALEDKQNERVTKEENLEKLYVRAPAEGKVTILAKQGQKIEENVPVAKFTPKPAPTAMFKLEKNMTMDRGLAVPIKVGEKMYTCEVADSTVDGTRVVCRMNAEGLAEGAEATLMVEQQQ
ncbi:MAG: hypothetical protein M4D80_31650 [Myxococcota bacterium]|nr:hypothetical protein [Myxococcota bacterium]